MCLGQRCSIFILKIAQDLIRAQWGNVYTQKNAHIQCESEEKHGKYRYSFVQRERHVPFSILILKRSPIPKLGERRPNVCGKVCENSDGVLVVPVIDLKRWSFEKLYLALVGLKFMASWVTSRHLCLVFAETLIII